MSRRIRWAAAGVLMLVLGAAAPAPLARQATPQPRITSPAEQFGHSFGDDYFLANYKQISTYWRKLATESDRIKVESIGKTAEGRTQLMAVVTSPENHKNLERYKEISRELALAGRLTDDQARALAKEGKAVVWIDGGLHASETLGAQQLGEMVYQMVSRNDEETLRFLNDVIVLFVHANPDGNDLVADWYMRNPVPEQRTSLGTPPTLYQKYIGHDNNRDFFASTQAETKNMNYVLYQDWFPQMLYNHHQSGPGGTILYSPPFRDPFNYNEDPLAVLGLEQMGNAIHMRLAAEGKPGATMRSGGPYDGWWNGGIRNTAVFHNTIAILTEMVGQPWPTTIGLDMARQLPNADLAYPVPPQTWHFRQSIDYSVSCNRAILDLASRMRENVLWNRYVMGKHSIERGSTDTWTPKPHRFAAIAAEVSGRSSSAPASAGATGGQGRGGRGGNDPGLWAALHRPEDRDPRAFIIPSDQDDFRTATKFVNALRETGIAVHQAPSKFTAYGKTYPAGSYVVFAAQAFRPHVMDMFEPQDHPDNFAVAGGPPTRPYDIAGWTLAFQMGVQFDRILGPISPDDIPLIGSPLPKGMGIVFNATTVGAYAMNPKELDSFIAANRFLAVNNELWRTPEGQFIAVSDSSTRSDVTKLALDYGMDFASVPVPTTRTAVQLKPKRIGLWDQYGGSIEAGWARWILEQFEFKFDRVFAPDLDAGGLNAKYDVLIFVGGALPGGGGGGGRAGGGGAASAPAAGAAATASQARSGGLPVPPEFARQMGSVSAATTMPLLKQFIENGGTVIALDSSATNLARYLELPMSNHLVEPSANGGPPQALPQSKFFVPGSVLRAHVDNTNIAALGMKTDTDFFFDNSQVWTLGPDAKAKGLTPIAWFDSKTPLRSGWAWGQAYLDGGVIAVEAKVGKGRVFLYGAEILQRGQPHPTFRLLFNGIYAK